MVSGGPAPLVPVWHPQYIDQPAAGRELLKEDRRRDTEAGVDDVVVEHARVGTVGVGRSARAARATGRQLIDTRREQTRLPGVDRASDHQIARVKPGAV